MSSVNVMELARATFPHVWVVVPAYNCASTVRLAMRSALRQRGVNVTLVAVDHGSTDGTLEAVERERFRWPESEVSVLSIGRVPGEKASASRPLNAGLGIVTNRESISHNEWFLRLDADDFLLSDTVLHEMLDEGTQSRDLIIGKLIFFDDRLQQAHRYGPRREWESRERLLVGGGYALPHHAMLVRRRALEAASRPDGRYYDEDIGYGEDLDLSLRLIRGTSQNQIVSNDHDVLCKSLGGAISNTAGSWSVLRDMCRVFANNPEISRSLLIRLGFDLLFRDMGPRLHWARRIAGQPSAQVGIWEPTPYTTVELRRNALKSEIQEQEVSEGNRV
jgi:glycosyltransferase involved in cell wall biosynthesis